jgi:hypothetical protein
MLHITFQCQWRVRANAAAWPLHRHGITGTASLLHFTSRSPCAPSHRAPVQGASAATGLPAPVQPTQHAQSQQSYDAPSSTGAAA